MAQPLPSSGPALQFAYPTSHQRHKCLDPAMVRRQPWAGPASPKHASHTITCSPYRSPPLSSRLQDSDRGGVALGPALPFTDILNAVLAELQPSPFWRAASHDQPLHLAAPAVRPCAGRGAGHHFQTAEPSQAPPQPTEQPKERRCSSSTPGQHTVADISPALVGRPIQLLSRSHIRPGPPPGAPIAHGTSRPPQLPADAIQCHKLAAATGRSMRRGP